MLGKACPNCSYIAESAKEKACPICQESLEAVCDDCGQPESQCSCKEPEELCELCNRPMSECECL